ncbi:hypothetical protein BGZ92_005664 [Podila epicladia]|nr:hypothetical protein BGZ92_005664 [Podila epicladia]
MQDIFHGTKTKQENIRASAKVFKEQQYDAFRGMFGIGPSASVGGHSRLSCMKAAGKDVVDAWPGYIDGHTRRADIVTLPQVASLKLMGTD